ncbi:hypothetical protein HELRODRAFT_185252 [Helobdella robusta]|uniref:t-SNARE coiled-coil homology domain-containing protein n=1 Tax=Helobdella robusta TaxID=6412 RepID=T1FMK2_HELRO|nr:hypothetical protein HELRODRAFT_185252 [Helobdella robusta]ESO10585.1 hypothetical protein HELRODRAFT_185252 [Helobdella robusta]
MAFNNKNGLRDYGSNQSPTIIGGPNMSDFNRLRHTISENCQKIRRNNIQMQKMVSQIGGPTDNLELRDKLHKVQHQTNELAKETNRNLQTLSSLVVLPSDSRQIKDQLTSEFTTALKDFQSLQRSQMSEEKRMLMKRKQQQQQQLQHQLRGKHVNLMDTRESGHGNNDDELRNGDDDNETFGQQQQQTGISKEDIEFLQYSEGQIKQLETDISDINQVFKDLSLLVHQQGEIIDSIEAHTESASYNVASGTNELMMAKSYRDKIRKRKFCIIAIVTTVIAILSLVVIIAASKS